MLPTETPIPVILDADKKDCLFETFPIKWRKQFIDTKTQDYYNKTVEDSIQFMRKGLRNQ